MWHFGKYGFTSAVAYDPTRDLNDKSAHPLIVLGKAGMEARKAKLGTRTKEQKELLAKAATTHILVRARVEADLEDLRRVCKSLVIEEDTSADYSFRAVITRDLFKKFLALHVDDIDYDSHFKEVAEKHGTQGAARHKAMMTCWGAMAALQPHSPYSGSTWYSDYSTGTGKYGSTWKGNSGASKSSTTSGSTGKASGTSASSVAGALFRNAAKDVDDFLTKYAQSGGELSFEGGRGPYTGFKKDDRVLFFGGAGKVTVVKEAKDKPDSVTVLTDAKTGAPSRIATFMSNYLMPESVPDVTLDKESMDDIYSAVLRGKGELGTYSGNDMLTWSDDAFEFYTRMQEYHGERAVLTKDEMDAVYDEVLWEASTDQEKRDWVSEGVPVPEKHEAEGTKIFQDFLAENISE